jgi:hypothetical protein
MAHLSDCDILLLTATPPGGCHRWIQGSEDLAILSRPVRRRRHPVRIFNIPSDYHQGSWPVEPRAGPGPHDPLLRSRRHHIPCCCLAVRPDSAPSCLRCGRWLDLHYRLRHPRQQRSRWRQVLWLLPSRHGPLRSCWNTAGLAAFQQPPVRQAHCRHRPAADYWQFCRHPGTIRESSIYLLYPPADS